MTALPFAALVAGTQAPDLALYLPFRVETLYAHGHTARGCVTVNLLVGLGLYGLWRGVLATPTRDPLDRPTRDPSPTASPLRRAALCGLAAAAVAVVLGPATYA